MLLFYYDCPGNSNLDSAGSTMLPFGNIFKLSILVINNSSWFNNSTWSIVIQYINILRL